MPGLTKEEQAEAEALAISAPMDSMEDPVSTIKLLEEIVARPVDTADAEGITQQEQARYKLAQLYGAQGGAYTAKLGDLITNTRPFLQYLSKAKAGKLVRSMVNTYLDAKHDNLDVAVKLVEDSIAWCQEEKRTFLRQALESRLIALHLDSKNYTQALKLGNQLVRELKKLDDKALLVEVQLLESKSYHRLSNLPKARAALTSARTSANAIYCPPSLQGALDLQSGVLHAEEKDFKTAYSYFYEAFENFDSIESPIAMSALKYMLLSKIMLNLPDDVNSIISGKLALQYRGRDIDAMKAVATAHHNRSLEEFEKSLTEYKTELSEDPIISTHLHDLYTTLLEQNLCRIIEPFSRVEIAHIASLIKLNERIVEETLSKMILDKKFAGILDQGAGCLIVFDDVAQPDKTYDTALETIQSMGKVVDSLYNKAQKLS